MTRVPCDRTCMASMSTRGGIWVIVCSQPAPYNLRHALRWHQETWRDTIRPHNSTSRRFLAGSCSHKPPQAYISIHMPNGHSKKSGLRLKTRRAYLDNDHCDTDDHNRPKLAQQSNRQRSENRVERGDMYGALAYASQRDHMRSRHETTKGIELDVTKKGGARAV